jgi:hypothetical protein
MGPSRRRARRPAASGAFGEARRARATLAWHRLRRMGAGTGDCPGRIVASRADVGVASDASRPAPPALIRQDVQLAPGIRGSGTGRNIRPGFRRYLAGRWTLRGFAPCDANYFSSAGSRALHADQCHRDHRGCGCAGLRLASFGQDPSLREGIWSRPHGKCLPGGDCRATALASDLRCCGGTGAHRENQTLG